MKKNSETERYIIDIRVGCGAILDTKDDLYKEYSKRKSPLTNMPVAMPISRGGCYVKKYYEGFLKPSLFPKGENVHTMPVEYVKLIKEECDFFNKIDKKNRIQ